MPNLRVLAHIVFESLVFELQQEKTTGSAKFEMVITI